MTTTEVGIGKQKTKLSLFAETEKMHKVSKLKQIIRTCEKFNILTYQLNFSIPTANLFLK